MSAAKEQTTEIDTEELRLICNISLPRARELLDAASGSIERAVDIHFFSMIGTISTAERSRDDGQTVDVGSESVEASEHGKKRATGYPLKRRGICSKEKQQRIDAFFSLSTTQPSTRNGHSEVESQWHTSSPIPSDTSHWLSSPDCQVVEKAQEALALNDAKSSSTYNAQIQGDLSEVPIVALHNPTSSSIMPTNSSAPSFAYSTVADALSEINATAKRTVKLEVLKRLFSQVLSSVGGIGGLDDLPQRTRWEDSLVFTQTIDLILGKLSVLNSSTRRSKADNRNSTSAPPPLQVNGSAVTTAIQTVTGASRVQLREAYRKTGDMGDAAAEYFDKSQKRSAQHFFVISKQERGRDETLSVSAVHEQLQKVCTVATGKGSQTTRQTILVSLLRSCQEKNEMRFLVRCLLGNMRLGATIKTVLKALAEVFTEAKLGHKHLLDCVETQTENKEFSPMNSLDLEAIYNICPRLLEISYALLLGGVECAASSCTPRVGFPIQPMLANPASSFDQVREFMERSDSTNSAQSVKQVNEALLEWKYDGIRCQAHFVEGEPIKLYSRNLLDISDQFIDVQQFIAEAKTKNVKSFMIDAEIVALDSLDSRTARLLPFQDLSTRLGKQRTAAEKVKVAVFCFDIMYENGNSVLGEPLYERAKIMRRMFRETRGFRFASSTTINMFDQNILQSALDHAVRGGAEGLMVKLTGGQNIGTTEVTSRSFGYESGVRGKLWLKLKRDYVAGDTVDLVPIGAWMGSGRKAQKGFLSPILFAVYDPIEHVFQSVCRCMSFSDDMYVAMREFYFHGTPYPPIVDDEADETHPMTKYASNGTLHGMKKNSDEECYVNCFTESRPVDIVTNENATIWFKPSEVFEMKFADLSVSKAHQGAANLLNDPDCRGLALRFPRFVRRRPDKSVFQATSNEELLSLFRRQSKTLTPVQDTNKISL